MIACIAAFILALAFGLRYSGSGGLCLFALMNLLFAVYIVGNTSIGADFLTPGMLFYVSHISFFFYALPILVFFYMEADKKRKKWVLTFGLIPVTYAALSFILNAARIMPFMLTDSGFNYAAGLSVPVLSCILAFGPAAKKWLSVIVRIHLGLYMTWGISAVLRLLFLDARVLVNIEFQIVWAFTLFSLTVFGVGYYARQIKRLQKTEYVMNLKVEALLQDYEQVKHHLREVSELKHEIKKHITALRLCMRNGLYKEAEDYLEQFANHAMPIADAVYHDDFLINAVVNNLIIRAEELGATVNLNIKAAPINIAAHEFYSLLSNIIENALEACAAMPKHEPRAISLNITRRDPYINIRCQNTKSGEIMQTNGRLQTTKPGQGHGYGLQIIRRIVDAHQGIMQIDHTPQTFTLTTALKDHYSSL
jgi:hypothetical protein